MGIRDTEEGGCSMRRGRLKASRLLACVSGVVLTVALAGCGGGAGGGAGASGAASGGSTAGSVPGQFTGAGASSQSSALGSWIADYQSRNRGVKITYNPTGSDAGLTTFLTGATAWAGTDTPLNDDQIERSKAVCASGSAFEVPDYLSSLALVFNLQGVFDSDVTPENKHLNIDAETLARIFDGRITTWSDPAIKELNPVTDLPDIPITVVHRSDPSGSTQVLTSYLKAAAPEAWGHDPSNVWQASGGQTAKGTSGVVSAVSESNGAIGYVDASRTGSLGTFALKVGQHYVSPSADAATKTVAASPVRRMSRSSNRVVVDVNSKVSAKDAYPLAMVSYAVACPAYRDAATGRFVKSWLTYVTGDDGQRQAQNNVGSAPLPSALAGRVARSISRISAK